MSVCIVRFVLLPNDNHTSYGCCTLLTGHDLLFASSMVTGTKLVKSDNSGHYDGSCSRRFELNEQQSWHNLTNANSLRAAGCVLCVKRAVLDFHRTLMMCTCQQ